MLYLRYWTDGCMNTHIVLCSFIPTFDKWLSTTSRILKCSNSNSPGIRCHQCIHILSEYLSKCLLSCTKKLMMLATLKIAVCYTKKASYECWWPNAVLILHPMESAGMPKQDRASKTICLDKMVLADLVVESRYPTWSTWLTVNSVSTEAMWSISFYHWNIQNSPICKLH